MKNSYRNAVAAEIKKRLPDKEVKHWQRKCLITFVVGGMQFDMVPTYAPFPAKPGRRLVFQSGDVHGDFAGPGCFARIVDAVVERCSS